MRSHEILSGALRLVPWPARRWVKHVPGVALLQRMLASSLLDGVEFVHQVDAGPARSITFRLRLPEDKGIWTGTYESMLAEAIARAVVPGTVAFDVGGWHGFFAGVMAAQGARSVHVFEPLPDNQARVRELCALNPGRNIVLHPVAAGERDGETNLVVMPETSMAKLAESTFQESHRSETTVRTVVRSLDAMVLDGSVEPPSVMKVDVEGAELMVLRGARQLLQSARPVVFVETHTPALLAQCRDLLTNVAYDVTLADGRPVVEALGEVAQIVARPR